jgi:glycosyltransferase involved in cell wall biosynthesis
VLEAWAAAVPSIMSRFCNLPEGFSEGASLECDVSVDSIRTALLKAVSFDDKVWSRMSEAALTLVDSTFSTATIASRWRAAYQSVAFSAA